MKKLKLNLDELTVESFATHRAGLRAGTVEGREATQYCGGPSRWCTDGGSCDGTCFMTCGDIPCNSYYMQCGTYDAATCMGGDCFNTDGENTCVHTCVNTCGCTNIDTC
jgi:hypothetical protein